MRCNRLCSSPIHKSSNSVRYASPLEPQLVDKYLPVLTLVNLNRGSNTRMVRDLLLFLFWYVILCADRSHLRTRWNGCMHAGAGAPDLPDLSKYFRPASTIRSKSQSSSDSSHASDADADSTASPPDSSRRKTLSPFAAREFHASNVHLPNAQPVTPLQTVKVLSSL